MVKTYCEKWNKEEINDYIDTFGILVLFKKHEHSNEAEIIIHGELSNRVKQRLKEAIAFKFGGKVITDELALRINILAERWYYKFVSKKPLYVLNYGSRHDG